MVTGGQLLQIRVKGVRGLSQVKLKGSRIVEDRGPSCALFELNLRGGLFALSKIRMQESYLSNVGMVCVSVSLGFDSSVYLSNTLIKRGLD